MAKVTCPKCGEVNKNLATKCFKCGASLRREHIKKYVESKHGDKLNYRKKGKDLPVYEAKKSGGSTIGKLIVIMILLVVLGAIGFAAVIFFEIIPMDMFL